MRAWGEVNLIGHPDEFSVVLPIAETIATTR